MMCDDVLQLISGHLDHENTPEEEAQLREHLEHCEACRSILTAFQEADEGLLMLREDAPAELRSCVMDAIHQEARPRKRTRRLWINLAAAASLLLVVGAYAVPSIGRHDASNDKTLMSKTVSTDAAAASEVAPAALEVENTPVYDEETGLFAMKRTLQMDPQDLAEEREADVAVSHHWLPEMEVCSCETLEDGSLLYCLEASDGAVQLSRIYGLELFQPSDGAASEVSYVLLVD